jgi:hypothetical protein
MALEIVGSGFGRTGTRSLKEALEILGYGPCHHMEEVFANPPQVPLWGRIVREGDVGALAQAYAGYRAQVDWPGAHAWREAAVLFPDAKVLHSTRPPESWWKSYASTIGKLFRVWRDMPLPPHIREMFTTMTAAIPDATFGGDPLDHDAAVAAMIRREAEVRAAIAPERLLVFDVAEGWGPLCAFLGKPVPEVAFPHRNVKDDFWAVLGGEPPG